jgi:hypothetical protein
VGRAQSGVSRVAVSPSHSPPLSASRRSLSPPPMRSPVVRGKGKSAITSGRGKDSPVVTGTIKRQPKDSISDKSTSGVNNKDTKKHQNKHDDSPLPPHNSGTERGFIPSSEEESNKAFVESQKRSTSSSSNSSNPHVSHSEAVSVALASAEHFILSLLSSFGQAKYLLCVYRCMECISCLHGLPRKHFSSGWVQHVIGRAYFELNDYKVMWSAVYCRVLIMAIYNIYINIILVQNIKC